MATGVPPYSKARKSSLTGLWVPGLAEATASDMMSTLHFGGILVYLKYRTLDLRPA